MKTLRFTVRTIGYHGIGRKPMFPHQVIDTATNSMVDEYISKRAAQMDARDRNKADTAASAAAAALGRLGGQVTSAAKSAAARANGAKGGRPRLCTNCGEPEKTRGESPRGGDFGWFNAPPGIVCLACGQDPRGK